MIVGEVRKAYTPADVAAFVLFRVVLYVAAAHIALSLGISDVWTILAILGLLALCDLVVHVVSYVGDLFFIEYYALHSFEFRHVAALALFISSTLLVIYVLSTQYFIFVYIPVLALLAIALWRYSHNIVYSNVWLGYVSLALLAVSVTSIPVVNVYAPSIYLTALALMFLKNRCRGHAAACLVLAIVMLIYAQLVYDEVIRILTPHGSSISPVGSSAQSDLLSTILGLFMTMLLIGLSEELFRALVPAVYASLVTYVFVMLHMPSRLSLVLQLEGLSLLAQMYLLIYILVAIAIIALILLMCYRDSGYIGAALCHTFYNFIVVLSGINPLYSMAVSATLTLLYYVLVRQR